MRLSLTFREDWLVLSNLLAQRGFKWEIDDQDWSAGRAHQIKVGFTLEKKRELVESNRGEHLEREREREREHFKLETRNQPDYC